MTKAQIKRRKGKQHGVNLLCGSGAWALGVVQVGPPMIQSTLYRSRKG